MPDENFTEIVDKIMQNDIRYRAGAYEFVNEAVSYTIRRLQREKKSKRERHVSGEELIRGLAEFAEEQFGPLAWNVLEDWGLVSGSAVGDVVFNMIHEGLLTAGENDSREDFNRFPNLKRLLRRYPKPSAKQPDGGSAPVIIKKNQGFFANPFDFTVLWAKLLEYAKTKKTIMEVLQT